MSKHVQMWQNVVLKTEYYHQWIIILILVQFYESHDWDLILNSEEILRCHMTSFSTFQILATSPDHCRISLEYVQIWQNVVLNIEYFHQRIILANAGAVLCVT